MSLRYQKRVNLGNGLGLNLSKTGFSSSYRSKYGSIGSRGYSIRTGIPGLSFRSYFGKSKKPEEQLIGLIVIALLISFVFAVLIVWNILRLLGWSTSEAIKALKRRRRNQAIRQLALTNQDPNLIFHQVSTDVLQPSKGKTFVKKLLIEPEQETQFGQEVVILGSEEWSIDLKSPGKAK